MHGGEGGFAPGKPRSKLTKTAADVKAVFTLITPWSPVRGGVLSGKYRRAGKGKHEAGRGAIVIRRPDDRTFDLLVES